MAVILVVDDTVESARLLGRLLAHFGHEVDVVHSGEAALERLAGPALPHLVILDLMMPGVDGFEVLRRFRSRPETHAVPVVIFSAIDDPAARARVLERGAQDYWTKGSFDFNRLRQRVNELTGTVTPAKAVERPN